MAVIDDFLSNQPATIIAQLNEFLSVEKPKVVALQCFPNPFTDEVHIEMASDAFGANEIAIYDLTGRKVYAQPCVVTVGQNEITIRPQLETGIYLLRMGGYTQKIVRY